MEAKITNNLKQWQVDNCHRCNKYLFGEDEYKKCKLAFSLDQARYFETIIVAEAKVNGCKHVPGSSTLILQETCKNLDTSVIRKKK